MLQISWFIKLFGDRSELKVAEALEFKMAGRNMVLIFELVFAVIMSSTMMKIVAI
jgi:hypothetical protein